MRFLLCILCCFEHTVNGCDIIGYFSIPTHTCGKTKQLCDFVSLSLSPCVCLSVSLSPCLSLSVSIFVSYYASLPIPTCCLGVPLSARIVVSMSLSLSLSLCVSTLSSSLCLLFVVVCCAVPFPPPFPQVSNGCRRRPCVRFLCPCPAAVFPQTSGGPQHPRRLLDGHQQQSVRREPVERTPGRLPALHPRRLRRHRRLRRLPPQHRLLPPRRL